MTEAIVFPDRSPTPLLAVERRTLFGAVATVLLVALTVGAGLGYYLGKDLSAEQRAALAELEQVRAALVEEQTYLAALQVDQQDQMAALALRLGDLQARATRVEALGERLAEVGQLEDGEFDFRSTPALGGPVDPVDTETFDSVAIESAIEQLNLRLDQRQQQLAVLGELITQGQLEATLKPSGRPVTSGWFSSGYGRRIDPFTGKSSAHPGIDFSGKAGADVVAVAAGVVTWSGLRNAYGNAVDIDHGNGYVTRYAHNQENLVAVGDRVEVGQKIALMGSTGRSTAPHVHFEVLKEGRRIDPTRFVKARR